MTVPSTRFREDYAGNGSATSFPYAFRIFKATDLVVTKTDSSGTDTTLTLGTDYTVTGAGSYNGGAVVLSTALPTSYRLTIERVLSIKQETDLRNQGEFLAETHEDAFDRLTMIVQRLAGYLGMGQGGTLRTLLLGTGDVDGAGAFRARGNRISGLGDPVDDTDAVGKRWTQEQIASAVNVDGSSMLGVFAITVDTIAGASGLLWPDKATVIARGRDTVGDEGGGTLRFMKGSTAAANDVTIYAINGGRLVREGWSVFGINVKWGGAKGDGVTDDTAACQASINASTGYFGGTYCEVLFPNGNYVIGNLRLRTGTRLRGTSKYGCWLTAKSGATAMIETEYNSGVGLNFRNQWAIECFTIRYDGLVSDTNSAALRLWNSYGNSIRDCYIYADNQRTSAAWGIWFGQGVYTTHIENVECKRVRVYSPTADRPTTLTFVNWDGGFMDIDNALSITLVQPVVQSRVDDDYGTYRVSVKNCFSFNATGGDYEDDDPSHFIYYFDNVTNHLVSMGNSTTGFAGGYAAYGPTGIAPTCKVLLQDDKNAGFEYREGNWTPSLAWSTPGTSSITLPTRGGSYVKNGNLATCTFYIDDATFTNGTANGYLVLSGLPFTAASGSDSWGGVPTLQIGFPTNMQSIQVLAGTKTAAFKKADGAASNVVVADVSGAGKFLRGTFTYKCAN